MSATTAEITAAAEAGPPTWADGEWSTFTLLLAEWWNARPEHWTDRRRAALAIALASFTGEQASAALRRLLNAGHEWPPKAVDIVNAIHIDRGLPNWVEARALLLDRPHGVVHAPVRRPVGGHGGEQGRLQAKEQAMLEQAAEHGEVIAAFVVAFGARRLLYLPVNDPDYGELELERLRERWTEFAESADARRREGQPLLTAPLRPRLEQGPRRLDPIAALGGASAEALRAPCVRCGCVDSHEAGCPDAPQIYLAGEDVLEPLTHGSRRGMGASSPVETVAFTDAAVGERKGPAAS